jgi:asparagine synthase (glutamine-hydrolysing)
VLCAAARTEAKILLSGTGADELFAGDRKHTAFRLAARYRRIPALLRRRGIEPFVRSLPTFRGTLLAGAVRRGKQLVRTGSLPQEEAFLMEGTYLDDGEKTLLYTPELRDRLDDEDPYDGERALLGAVKEADFINRMLYLDLKSALPAHTLTVLDRTGMANSVEVRSPFLDRDLASFAFTEVPPDWKVTDDDRPRTKQVLRRALKGIVPDDVIGSPHTGFGAPLERWLARDLREMVGDMLSGEQVRRRALFNPGSVATLVKEHHEGRRDWSYQIWQLLTLELWQREFLDR